MSKDSGAVEVQGRERFLFLSFSLPLSLFHSLVIESARAPPDGTQEMPRSALRRSAEALALVAVFLDLGEQASVLSLFEVVPLARSLALSVDVVGRRNQSACLPLFFCLSLSLSLSRARARFSLDTTLSHLRALHACVPE